MNSNSLLVLGKFIHFLLVSCHHLLIESSYLMPLVLDCFFVYLSLTDKKIEFFFPSDDIKLHVSCFHCNFLLFLHQLFFLIQNTVSQFILSFQDMLLLFSIILIFFSLFIGKLLLPFLKLELSFCHMMLPIQ